MWDDDTHEPVAVFERYQCSSACFVAGGFLEFGEERRILECHGEGEPIAFGGSGVEV